MKSIAAQEFVENLTGEVKAAAKTHRRPAGLSPLFKGKVVRKTAEGLSISESVSGGAVTVDRKRDSRNPALAIDYAPRHLWRRPADVLGGCYWFLSLHLLA